MKKYVVAAHGGATFPPGHVLRLDGATASRFGAHQLKPGKGGRHETLQPVTLKRGTEFGFEGDMPKSLAALLVDPAEAATEKPAAAEPALPV